MGKMLIGMVVGATCTAIITCSGTKCLKKTKKMLVNRIENLMK